MTKKAAPRGKWSSLSLANSSRGGSLHGRRRSRSRSVSWLLRRRRTIGGVGHQANVHSTVLCPAVSGLVGIDWLILAQADQVDLVRRNIVLRSQILNHRISATLAE